MGSSWPQSSPVCCGAIGLRWGAVCWVVATAAAAPPLSQFDDSVLPLVPRTERRETETDRIEAQALFATARLLQDQGQLRQDRRQMSQAAWYQTAALRKYQRAFRRDPQATRILHTIVALAQATGRIDEAARYATIAIERDPSDVALARWLAVYYVDLGQWHEARRLYETIVEVRARQPETAALPETHLSLWLELGRLAYLTEQFPQASAAFTAVEKALGRPLSGASDRRVGTVLLENAQLAFQLFGNAHLEAGNLDAAETAFRKAYPDTADRAALAFHLARVARQREDPERARAQLQECLDQGDAREGTAPYELLAGLLADQGQQELLIDRLERLRQDDTKNLPLTTFLAQQYLKEDQLPPAARLFRQVLGQVAPQQRLPRSPQAVQDAAAAFAAANQQDDHIARGSDADILTESLQGLTEICRRQGDVEALRQILAETVAQTDSLECLSDPLAKIAADQGLLDKLLQKAPAKTTNETAATETAAQGVPGLDGALAELAITTRRFDSAAHFCQRALERSAIDRDADRAANLLRNWGLALLEAEDYAAAADVFRQGIARQLGPQDAAVRKGYRASLFFFLAGALEMTGATDRALAAAQRATELQPTSALIASRQPWINHHAKRRAAARKGYQALIDAFDLKDNSRPARNVLQVARFELSQLAIEGNDVPAAQQWLEQVLDEDPRNVGALNDLGFLWADQGKHLQRALEMVRAAVAAEPDNRAYRDSLGWVHYRLSQYHEAIGHLQQAAAGAAPDAIVLDHLGDCYNRLGLADDAVAAWRKSLEQLESTGLTTQAGRVREKLNDPRKAVTDKVQCQ